MRPHVRSRSSRYHGILLMGGETMNAINDAALIGSPSLGTRGVSLHVKRLSKQFGTRLVLNHLDLHVDAGEFVAIIGKSGCGKSTLLRLIAGLETANHGTIRFGTPPRERQAHDVRVMYQEPRLLPWARIDDNVAIGLGDGFTTAEGPIEAKAALQAVGLNDRVADWPRVLSGGQKQRVALARALVSKPAVLALDEPLGALDALTRIEMQSLLENVWLQEGFTALMVTHDVSEAVALADRVILLEDGQVTLDRRIHLQRPRQRGQVEFAALEAEILARVFGHTEAA